MYFTAIILTFIINTNHQCLMEQEDSNILIIYRELFHNLFTILFQSIN